MTISNEQLTRAHDLGWSRGLKARLSGNYHSFDAHSFADRSYLASELRSACIAGFRTGWAIEPRTTGSIPAHFANNDEAKKLLVRYSGPDSTPSTHGTSWVRVDIVVTDDVWTITGPGWALLVHLRDAEKANDLGAYAFCILDRDLAGVR